MSSPDRFRRSGRLLRAHASDEIPSIVSETIEKHMTESKSSALKKHKAAWEKHVKALSAERKEREEYLRAINRASTSGMDDREPISSTQDQVLFDPSLSSLDAIVERAEKAKPNGDDAKDPKPLTVTMSSVKSVPKYDAWVPVKENHWAGKELHVQPYMPFLGDDEENSQSAFEVYEDMSKDVGKDLDLSDGELGPDGEFLMPKDDVDRHQYYSLDRTRWREGARKAILEVLKRHSRTDERVWKVLGSALGISNVQHVKALARVASDRSREKIENEIGRDKLIRMRAAIKSAEENPQDEIMPEDKAYSAACTVLKKFCFTCMIFGCAQHAHFDVEPVLPILDANQLKREKLLNSGKAKPCGDHCFLNMEFENKCMEKDGLHAHSGVHDVEWSAEEIMLLREAAPVYGIDPCHISIAIGSRTCADVHLRLQDPVENELIKSLSQNNTKAHRRKARMRKKNIVNSKNPKQKVLNARKGDLNRGSSSTCTDPDFIPCYHKGPCTKEVCSCVKNSLHCESTCGCNFGRFQDVNGEGLVEWKEPTEEMVRKGIARICNNRHFGCSCEAGNCSLPDCPCWDHNRACNPDFCDCDVCELPSRIGLRNRRCRNVPINLAVHKRSFVGKSSVHGFGLFAGEKFEAGDVVGVYNGQLIDSQLAGMIERLYNTNDHTYIFNASESLVIDAGSLGSKVKFVNHATTTEKENCTSRLIRVKGDTYVALFAKRAITPGEEFLFDYRFTGEAPEWTKQ